MERPLYAPRGVYGIKGSGPRRGGQSLRRQLLQTIIPGADEGAAIDQDLFWVSDVAGDWNVAANWATSTGGTGGAGIPGPTNQVTFDGEGTGKCTLTQAITCKELVFNETGAAVNANFDQAGYAINCSTFAYNCATNTSTVLDGPINVSGATFVVTAMQNDAILASASINTAIACSITSTDDTAIPAIIAQDDITIATTMTVAALQIAVAAKDLVVGDGLTLTLTAYTAGDWDDLANLISAGATWNFVNPAGMVCSDIANVEDSNATNEVDATDGCVDGTGNTNWTFV